MDQEIKLNPEVEVRLLRAQVERLTNRNLDLQRQVEELARQKAEMTVEEIVAGLQRTIRAAEEAMAEEAAEGRRYVIPELQVTLRGVFSYSDKGLVFGLARPEQTVPAAQLGNAQLTVTEVPSVTSPKLILALREALEKMQVAFSEWGKELGATEAKDMVSRASHLLTFVSRCGEEEFLRATLGLAEAMHRFGEAAAKELPPDRLAAYQAAAERLTTLTLKLTEAGRASPTDMERFADALDGLTRNYRDLL